MLSVIIASCAGTLPQSLGEDAEANAKTPRKRLRLTRCREKMDSDFARGFAPNPGDAGGSGAICESSADAADVDRTGRRVLLQRAEASAPLPLDRSAADSRDVPGTPLDFGRSAILSARGV